MRVFVFVLVFVFVCVLVCPSLCFCVTATVLFKLAEIESIKLY